MPSFRKHRKDNLLVPGRHVQRCRPSGKVVELREREVAGRPSPAFWAEFRAAVASAGGEIVTAPADTDTSGEGRAAAVLPSGLWSVVASASPAVLAFRPASRPRQGNDLYLDGKLSATPTRLAVSAAHEWCETLRALGLEHDAGVMSALVFSAARASTRETLSGRRVEHTFVSGLAGMWEAMAAPGPLLCGPLAAALRMSGDAGPAARM
jgi:hypothetical protein